MHILGIRSKSITRYWKNLITAKNITQILSAVSMRKKQERAK